MKYLLQITAIILLPLVIGKTVYFEDSEKFISTPYPEHIAGAYTGGFGEESCHSCHFDYDLNQPEGELLVSGIGDSFKPGESHTITITVKRENLGRAGFQMTARFQDSIQAGSFELSDELTTTPNIDNDITYVQHGVGKVKATGDEKSWKVTWITPNQTKKPVIFNLAVNAANGDASEFGDWIYVREIQAEPND